MSGRRSHVGPERAERTDRRGARPGRRPRRGVALAALCLALAAFALPARAAANVLQNGGFDAGGIAGWQVQGADYGSAGVVAQPVVSAPGALSLTAKSAGSSGDKSLMVFQVLDRTPFLGKKVRFGAQVR